MLDELQGEQQVLRTFGADGLGRAGPVVGCFHAIVALLNEVAVQGRTDRGAGQRAGLTLQQDAVLFLRQHGKGIFFESRRNDHFTEERVDEFGGLQVDGAVGNQDATEGACGVACQSVGVGFRQRGTCGTSTSVVVLENRESGGVVLELLHELHRGVHIEQVVVRQGLAVQGFQQIVQVAEVLARLVGVLAVPQCAGLGHTDVQDVHAATFEVRAAEVRVNHGVIVRAHAEAARGEGLALFEGGGPIALQDVHKGAVVVHRGHDDHVVEVLGRAANEGDASDVDFLHDVRFRGAAGHGGFEGVQIHHDQVDVGEVVLRHLGLVTLVVPTVENAAKHLGMKRLHTASQNGGVVRHRFHGNHLCPHRFNCSLGATG